MRAWRRNNAQRFIQSDLSSPLCRATRGTRGHRSRHSGAWALAWQLAGDNAGAVLGITLAIKMVAYVTLAPIAAAVAATSFSGSSRRDRRGCPAEGVNRFVG